MLVDELHAVGLTDVALDEHGYVFATLPAPRGLAGDRPARPRRHQPGRSGAGVEPIVHRATTAA